MDKKMYWQQFFPKYVQRFIVYVCVIAFIQLFSGHPKWVETYYSTLIYPYISLVLRFSTGWLSISIGDLLYVFCILSFVYYLYKRIKRFRKQQLNWQICLQAIFSFLNFLCIVYIVFNFLWGLNYRREGIATQLNIQSNETYTTSDLQNLTCDLLEAINAARLALGDSLISYPTHEQSFSMCEDAYQAISTKIPFFSYKIPSVKSSLLTEVVSNAGYAGYFNPFTGEAQINTDLPEFVIPFVAAHEMAHQLGYASESEANFVSYLVCSQSSNKWLRYSALFELFSIANNELLETDFWAAVLNLKTLHPLVKRDKRIYRNYLLGKQSYIEPVMKNMYHQYLKANAQQSGIDSYNEVTAWVIAYTKKYGKHSL